MCAVLGGRTSYLNRAESGRRLNLGLGRKTPKSANGGDIGGWDGDLMAFWADRCNSEQRYADPPKFARNALIALDGTLSVAQAYLSPSVVRARPWPPGALASHGKRERGA
ncbi:MULTISPECIES: hypothetical protein [Streptomyces]|uniref:Uncharacterized protein n=1 Tax=Streptomyces ramulosus TaxID=47762 RepID=A0ABW1FFK0_9ACTN